MAGKPRPVRVRLPPPFCGAVSNAGGGRRGNFDISLNRDNLNEAVQRTREELERHRDWERRRERRDGH